MNATDLTWSPVQSPMLSRLLG